jgi:hypothetical protein
VARNLKQPGSKAHALPAISGQATQGGLEHGRRQVLSQRLITPRAPEQKPADAVHIPIIELPKRGGIALCSRNPRALAGRVMN